VDAQFSVYFQTAVALLDGAVTWSSYGRIGSEDVIDLIKRIDLTVDDELPEAGAILTGAGAEVRVDVPSGEDLSWDLVDTKYTNLTSDIFGADAQAAILAWTHRPSGPVRGLTRLLSK
jgi:2-methylcitrate dehydratase PrpD